MQAASKHITSLSIARHAVQFILHSAMDASPDRCCGIVGLNGTLISRAVALPNRASDTIRDCELAVHSGIERSKNCDLQHIADEWRDADISISGTYFTGTGEVPDISELKKFENALTEKLPTLSSTPFTHLVLMLNTAGCLEAFAYRIDNGSLLPITLVLEEDGQQQKNG